MNSLKASPGVFGVVGYLNMSQKCSLAKFLPAPFGILPQSKIKRQLVLATV